MSKPLKQVAVLALLAFFPTCLLAATNNTDDVRKVVEGFSTAWNHHDMDAFGKLFAPDADFVNVGGALWKGRQDIQERHAWSHGAIPKTTPGYNPAYYGMFKHSTMEFTRIEVRFLRQDVALARVAWQLSGDARTTSLRHGMLLFVLTRGADGWQIAAAQNTEINRTVK